VGAPALSYVAGSTHSSVGPINGAFSPFRVAFTIAVAMLEPQPSAPHAGVRVAQQEGSLLVVRRCSALLRPCLTGDTFAYG
jgi:hypothetical protein